MVWNVEGHGLYFQEFTDNWKRPAHEQLQYQWATPEVKRSGNGGKRREGYGSSRGNIIAMS